MQNLLSHADHTHVMPHALAIATFVYKVYFTNKAGSWKTEEKRQAFVCCCDFSCSTHID